MDKARAAVERKVPMGENVTQEELVAYHHYLEISRRHLEATLQELNEHKQHADESSARRAALSASASRSSARTPTVQPRHRSRVHMLSSDSRRETTKSLESDFMMIDDASNIITKTPEASVLAVTTYLQSTQPPEDDPRAAIHQSALHGLRIMGAAITQKTAENVGPSTTARHAGGAPPRHEGSPRHPVVRYQETQPRNNQNHDNHGQGGEGDMRSHLSQKKVDKSRAKRATREDSDPNSIESKDDEVEPCGARCFIRSPRGQDAEGIQASQRPPQVRRIAGAERLVGGLPDIGQVPEGNQDYGNAMPPAPAERLCVRMAQKLTAQLHTLLEGPNS
jgi:hypothetical protein